MTNRLDLSQQQLSDEEIAKMLLENDNITTLNLSCTTINSNTIKLLAENKTIANLNLSYTNIGCEEVKILAKNKTITNLNLNHTEIVHHDNKSICECIKALSENETIVQLNLSNNCISSKQIKKLAQMKNLKVLIIAENVFYEQLNDHLLELTNIDVLDISGRIKAMHTLANFLRHTTVKQIKADCININYFGIQHDITQAIVQNKNLIKLHLSGAKFIKASEKLIKQNKTILKLITESNVVNKHAKRNFDNYKKRNKKLTKIMCNCEYFIKDINKIILKYLIEPVIFYDF